MNLGNDPTRPIDITVGRATGLLQEALMETLVLPGTDEHGYAKLAFDLARKLADRQDERHGQRQDSTTDQLRDLAIIGERHYGMYDAANWIRRGLMPRTEDPDPRVPTVLHCPGCGRPYSERGYVNKTEIGCTETYAATGESPVQAFCAEKDRYV
jgi:hypothetical protein